MLSACQLSEELCCDILRETSRILFARVILQSFHPLEIEDDIACKKDIYKMYIRAYLRAIVRVIRLKGRVYSRWCIFLAVDFFFFLAVIFCFTGRLNVAECEVVLFIAGNIVKAINDCSNFSYAWPTETRKSNLY